ncbi:MAG: Smr/MutS family protein [Desulfobulbus sp.]
MICPVCGNEVAFGHKTCPFCGSPCQTEGVTASGILHRQINLERGKPLVQQALDRLESELVTSRSLGCKVLTLIHGYGSSGIGGAIKEAVLRQLQFLQYQDRIKNMIPGEHFEGRSGRGRQLLRQYPFLADHRDLNRANPGITLVIL